MIRNPRTKVSRSAYLRNDQLKGLPDWYWNILPLIHLNIMQLALLNCHLLDIQVFNLLFDRNKSIRTGNGHAHILISICIISFQNLLIVSYFWFLVHYYFGLKLYWTEISIGNTIVGCNCLL